MSLRACACGLWALPPTPAGQHGPAQVADGPALPWAGSLRAGGADGVDGYVHREAWVGLSQSLLRKRQGLAGRWVPRGPAAGEGWELVCILEDSGFSWGGWFGADCCWVRPVMSPQTSLAPPSPSPLQFLGRGLWASDPGVACEGSWGVGGHCGLAHGHYWGHRRHTATATGAG